MLKLLFMCFLCLLQTTSYAQTTFSTTISTESIDISTTNFTSSSTETSSTTKSSESTTPLSTIPPSTDASTTTVSSTTTETSSTTETTPFPTTTPTSTTIPPHKITDSFTWSSTKLDQNPIVVTVPEGYFISVTVSGINMSDGNYLIIKGGNSYSDESTDGLVFANTVEGPLTYLFEASSVYGYCETQNSGKDNFYEFTAIFEIAGDGPTTTVSTTSTTTITVPTTEEGASTYITVDVSGKTLSEYNDEAIVDKFKQCVVILATNYCKNQDIPLTKEITNTYVMISEINRCPYSWPHSESCVKIRFKLPIFYNETSTVKNYQLNTQRLEDMWLRWDQLDDQCFSKNQFSVYEEPDVEQSIVWWAVGISLILLAFIALLWFLKSFSAKVRSAIKKRMRRRNSDTKSIISSRKESYSSLTPHYLQDHLDTPKFFDG